MDLQTLAKNLANANREGTFKYLVDTFQVKTAIEVGVLHGYFSDVLLSAGVNLIGIDIEKLPRISDLERIWREKFKFVEKTSVNAINDFDNESLDLIYLDNDHSYEYVIEELFGWWPKLKIGGLMTGHDYIKFRHNELGDYGVIEAVEEFGMPYCVNGCSSTRSVDMRNYGASVGLVQEKIQAGLSNQHNEIPNFIIPKI